MAEVVYLVAATLWIVVVLGALCFAGWIALKLRAKRRRVHQFFDAVRLPVELRRHVLLAARICERAARARPAAARALTAAGRRR
ncbi:hypothetical protein JRC04_18715 [Mycolicibacterium sp. S2-37]|uniref:hypothetical protein n=1 Tax=Mycolicibacterium sp. S2-37 TaxID=2810297 RepID=UPI001A946098|nr:hypothetical protein [Mycolicibacterium sp. S2-37]MBO0679499.1 hypothetical protein [Mycolicibacterium sp. S2-37]